MGGDINWDIHNDCCQACDKAVKGRLGGKVPCQSYDSCEIYIEEYSDYELEQETDNGK